ncbi:MAG: hypothetical protein ACRDFA_10510 [bacterium]
MENRCTIDGTAVTVANDLPLQAAWQMNVPCERITCVYGTLALVAVAVRPASIITTVPHMFI